MKKRFPRYFYLLTLLLSLAGCSKWEDKTGPQPDLTNRYYCNLPEAINYNYGFPGKEDNSICIFPSQPFAGTYSYRDSLYFGNDPVVQGDTFNFSITAPARKQVLVNDFCASRSLSFTADRYYKAVADTIIGPGMQLLCRDLDTLTGNLVYRPGDSSLIISFTVVSDTGFVLHKGTAYKK